MTVNERPLSIDEPVPGEVAAAAVSGSRGRALVMITVGDAEVRDGSLIPTTTGPDTGDIRVAFETTNIAANGLRFDLEIAADSSNSFSRPIAIGIRMAHEPASHFWTAWASPSLRPEAANSSGPLVFNSENAEPWLDPLVTVPLRDSTIYYGATPFSYEHPQIPFRPFAGNITCLPLVSILSSDCGWTIALDPHCFINTARIEVSTSGLATIVKEGDRLSRDVPHRFSFFVFTHKPSWRAGLEAFRRSASEFFRPVAPRAARKVSGSGAFSNREGRIDSEFLHSIGFAANWKASYDFPYMGMFIPPVGGNDGWQRFGGGSTSIDRLADYARDMVAQGFQCLNYFNVFEFGAYVAPDLRHAKSSTPDWTEPETLLRGPFNAAIVKVPGALDVSAVSDYPRTFAGGFFYTWKDGVIVDPADPEYQSHLLQQGRRLIEAVPDAIGIVIDRLDWVRLVNEECDDAVSMFDGKPVRSLMWSWRSLLRRLGPIFHSSEKIILANNHVKRIDLLEDIDGIFDEYTYSGCALNLTGLLCLDMPAMGWLNSEKQIASDPDFYFQRFLHMGVFPMAPFPDNDHGVEPSPWVEKAYRKYGTLFRALMGRRWYLEGEVETSTGRANIFEVSGRTVVVVTQGEGDWADLDIIGVQESNAPERCTVVVPGPEEMSVTLDRSVTSLRCRVPLMDGCAVVQF